MKCQFYSRQTNMVNMLRERTVKIVLNNHVCDSEARLHKTNSKSSHHRNIQMFMIEHCKIKNLKAPQIMNAMLNKKNVTYNFRHLQEFQPKRKRTAFYDIETISYSAPELLTILPEEIKQRNKICLFKSGVKQCNLCKVIAPSLRFI